MSGSEASVDGISDQIGAARRDLDNTSCASSEQRLRGKRRTRIDLPRSSDTRATFDRGGFCGGGAKHTHTETNRVSERSIVVRTASSVYAHERARARAMGPWSRYDVGPGTTRGWSDERRSAGTDWWWGAWISAPHLRAGKPASVRTVLCWLLCWAG